MNATDLQNIVTDFSELPKGRESLLAALPAFLVKHFRGAGVVSRYHQHGLKVMASSHPDLTVGLEPPEAALALKAVRSDSYQATDTASGLPGMPFAAAWPLRERMATIATLQVFRNVPLAPATLVTLDVFTRLISSRLTDSSRSLEATVLAEVVTALGSATSVREGAVAALQVLIEFGRADAGYFLQLAGGKFRQLTHAGTAPSPERAAMLGLDSEKPAGLVWEACRTGETLFAPKGEGSGEPDPGGTTIVHPLGWRNHYRFVLVIRFTPRGPSTPTDLDMFQSISTQLHIGLERLQADHVQDRLLQLQTKVMDAVSGDLYATILSEAVELVPGASAGSLLVRGSSSHAFRFKAVQGFPGDSFYKLELSDRHMRRWYGGSDEYWQAGEPRELRHSDSGLAQLSREAAEREEELSGTRDIKANLCLPVSFRGEVLAVLNLDNLRNERAFGEDSVKVLKQFAPVISSLLGAARQFGQIVDMANTDKLTGLLNRRGGDQALRNLLAASQLSGQTYVLLSMDLSGFKQVNDRFGHEVGDGALQDVAAALSAAARSGDTVVRWGGDEFVVLLPAADLAIAEQVAGRLSASVDGLRVQDLQLGISIGAAMYPDDAVTGEGLLHMADDRMYRQKLPGTRGRSS